MAPVTVSFKERSLGQKIHIVLIVVLVLCTMAATLVSISIVAYYNHWIGWQARTAFWIVSVVIFTLIVTCYYDLRHISVGPGTYLVHWRNMALVVCLLIVEFALAGLTVHPWTPCWDITSGKIQPCHGGLCWDNPFAQTLIIPKEPAQDWFGGSPLFPGRIVDMTLNGSVRTGTSVEKLKSFGYITQQNTQPNDWGAISRAIDAASQYAILECGASAKDLKAGKIPVWQQKKYLERYRVEIIHQLPDYLKANPEIRVRP